MTTKQDKPSEPKEPEVVALDDPTVPYSLVPVGGSPTTPDMMAQIETEISRLSLKYSPLEGPNVMARLRCLVLQALETDRVRAAAAPQPQPEALTADDLNFIASVLTDVASERAESEDQPDGAHDAAVLWRIARTAAKQAFCPPVDHGAVPASPWQPISSAPKDGSAK